MLNFRSDPTYPTSFSDIPDDLLFKITNDYSETPHKKIQTLIKLKEVCKDFESKIEKSLPTFIQNIGIKKLLICPFSKVLDFKNPNSVAICNDFIKRQFPILLRNNIELDKWNKGHPIVKSDTYEGGFRQSIVNDHNGNPNLILVGISGDSRKFKFINLMILKSFQFELAKNVVYSSKPTLALSEHWFAICCQESGKMNITIFDYQGSRLHQIYKIGKIFQMHCEGGSLYVLCKESKDHSILLKYDSNNWCKALKITETIIKKNIQKFYFGKNEILLISSKGKEYDISAIRKDQCFSLAESSLIQEPAQSSFPIIKNFEDSFLTMSSKLDPEDGKIYSWLEKLEIVDSRITRTPLLKLPLNLSEVIDFCVQFDKIFILMQKEKK